MTKQAKLVETKHGALSASYKFENSKLRPQHAKSPQQAFSTFFTEVFLPQGFPKSVSSDYIAYQTYDTAQAFCSSISGTLATQAVLKGVGVGDASATAAAATITHLLRDATGMLTGIAFAWLQGSDLDNNAKQWRLVADVLNDLSLFIELLSPLFPSYFVLLVCVASFCRAIVGVAGGATRAALIQHQALNNNMGDVAAKDGSQETLVNLSALITSLIITPIVSNNFALTWCLFIIATMLHIYCNYKAVRALVMTQCNGRRASILAQHYLKDGSVLTPEEANAREPLFPGHLSGRVFLAPSLSKLQDKYGFRIADADMAIIDAFLTNDNDEGHIMVWRDMTAVLLKPTAKVSDKLLYFMAAVIRTISDRHDHVTCLQESGRLLETMPGKGWDVSSCQLFDYGYRIEPQRAD